MPSGLWEKGEESRALAGAKPSGAGVEEKAPAIGEEAENSRPRESQPRQLRCTREASVQVPEQAETWWSREMVAPNHPAMI